MNAFVSQFVGSPTVAPTGGGAGPLGSGTDDSSADVFGGLVAGDVASASPLPVRAAPLQPAGSLTGVVSTAQQTLNEPNATAATTRLGLAPADVAPTAAIVAAPVTAVASDALLAGPAGKPASAVSLDSIIDPPAATVLTQLSDLASPSPDAEGSVAGVKTAAATLVPSARPARAELIERPSNAVLPIQSLLNTSAIPRAQSAELTSEGPTPPENSAPSARPIRAAGPEADDNEPGPALASTPQPTTAPPVIAQPVIAQPVLPQPAPTPQTSQAGALQSGDEMGASKAQVVAASAAQVQPLALRVPATSHLAVAAVAPLNAQASAAAAPTPAPAQDVASGSAPQSRQAVTPAPTGSPAETTAFSNPQGLVPQAQPSEDSSAAFAALPPTESAPALIDPSLATAVPAEQPTADRPLVAPRPEFLAQASIPESRTSVITVGTAPSTPPNPSPPPSLTRAPATGGIPAAVAPPPTQDSSPLVGGQVSAPAIGDAQPVRTSSDLPVAAAADAAAVQGADETTPHTPVRPSGRLNAGREATVLGGAHPTASTRNGGLTAERAIEAVPNSSSEDGQLDAETAPLKGGAQPHLTADARSPGAPSTPSVDPTPTNLQSIAAPANVQSSAQAAPTPSQPVAVTVADLSAQIARKTDQGSSRFDVQLTPDGLGRVDVAVEIDAKGRVTASLSFEKADSAALLKDHSDDLQVALQGAGLTLAPDALKFNHTLSAGAQATAGHSGAAGGGTTNSPNVPTGGSTASASTGDLSAGGQSFQQGQGSPQGQSDRAPAYPTARSFAVAAEAADVADRQAAWRVDTALRGLDIRI